MAFDALRLVTTEGAYANLILAKLLGERSITGQDAAFATELVAGTCRGMGTYDLIIAAAGNRELKTLQPAVLDLLRLGTHQLLAMRVPSHAAVSAMVDLAAATVGERITGVVNAVLRRVAAHDQSEWVDQLSDGLDERERLVVATAHPRWIIDAFADVLPGAELEAALEADNHSPPITLVIRPGLAEVGELIEAGGIPGTYSPFAVRWVGSPGELPAVRDGRAGVQDEGSQLVAWALTRAPAPDGQWLELCAGPGGKTALLAGLMASAGGLGVVAAEVAPHRAALVTQAVRTYRDHRIAVIIADGTQPAWAPDSFSRVLADVPCTGLGALRRRPESRWRRGEVDVEHLHPLQLALLNTAIEATDVGGIIGYVTCSPHRRETVDVVEETLADRRDVEVIPVTTLLPELTDAARGPYLQLWPHRHGTDAMFAAYLRRISPV